jgi:hypothetical protein
MISFLAGCFYFVFGLVVAYYLKVLFAPTEKDGKKDNTIKIYMNLYFSSPKDIVENIARSKFSSKRPVIRALAKRLLTYALEDSIAKRITTSICEGIPEKVGLIGIVCVPSIVLTRQQYSCVELHLKKIDYKRFFRNSIPLYNLFQYLAFFPDLEFYIGGILLGIVSKKLLDTLPTQISEKMRNNLDAEVTTLCCNESELGSILVSTLMELDASSCYSSTAATKDN